MQYSYTLAQMLLGEAIASELVLNAYLDSTNDIPISDVAGLPVACVVQGFCSPRRVFDVDGQKEP
jgi:D-aminopeptidase